MTPEQDQSKNEVQPFMALMKSKKLNLPTQQGLYDMLIDTWNEKHQFIQQELADTVWRVAIGYGFLMYDQLTPTKQATYLQMLYHMREQNEEWKQQGMNVEIDTLTLSQEEANILRDIASEVNIIYDPGDETTPEKRVFTFADVESKPPSIKMPWHQWQSDPTG